MTNAGNQSSGYEKKDVNIPLIMGVSLTGIVLIVIMVLVLIDIFKLQKENEVYNSVLSQQSKDLVELIAMEKETLNSYKLLDAKKGIYQIPIKRAMQLLAEE